MNPIEIIRCDACGHAPDPTCGEMQGRCRHRADRNPPPVDQPMTSTDRVILQWLIVVTICGWLAIAWILNWIFELSKVGS